MPLHCAPCLRCKRGQPSCTTPRDPATAPSPPPPAACPQYWDDPSDAVQPQQAEGTLLPLWEFHTPRARHRAVTALCWSARHPDLFAAGYGSFDFLHPTTGLVACFSLKNPGHPECAFGTAAGVMCLDFHPDHPSLLAVGCYDGRVAVFDVRAGASATLGVMATQVGGGGREDFGGACCCCSLAILSMHHRLPLLHPAISHLPPLPFRLAHLLPRPTPPHPPHPTSSTRRRLQAAVRVVRQQRQAHRPSVAGMQPLPVVLACLATASLVLESLPGAPGERISEPPHQGLV